MEPKKQSKPAPTTPVLDASNPEHLRARIAELEQNIQELEVLKAQLRAIT